MSNILIVPALIAFAVWGYFLMGRLDHFLDTRVRKDDDTTDDGSRHGK